MVNSLSPVSRPAAAGLSLPAACVAFALSLLAAPAQADSVRAERLAETLDAGGTWRSDTLAVDRAWSARGRELRLNARGERETRPTGAATRQYLQGSISAGPGMALEVGAGHGSGAAYSWRSAQHLAWYQGVGTAELSASAARLVYDASTVLRLSGTARLPLAGMTAIVGASGARAQGRTAGAALQLGLEVPARTCQLAANLHWGRELAAPEQADSVLLGSRTVHTRLRCPLGTRVALEIAASATRAGQLTRQGVSGAVVVAY